MGWRPIILVLSVMVHVWWLTGADELQPPQLSGGSQSLPVSVLLATVTLASKPPIAEAAPSPPLLAKPPLKPQRDKTKKKPALTEPKEPIKHRKEQLKIQKPETQQPAMMAHASAQKKEPDIVGLKALPVVKEAGFRSRPVPPSYPKLCLRKKQQGEVLVQALVDKHGDTREVRLVRSSGFHLLDKSAMTAVKGWLFKPARIDDAPIMAWVEVPVGFEIN